MSKSKLDEALVKQLNRFSQITKYQDDLVSEGLYQFHQDLPESDETEDLESNIEEPMDNTASPTDPQGGLNDAPENPGTNEPAGVEDPNIGDEVPMDNTTPPTDGIEEPMNDAEDTTEVDVTDLVNNSNEIKMSVTNMISKIDQTSQQFNNMMSRVNNIEGSVSKMDTLIGKMEQLAKQVELMRPPTEEERRKAVANNSYPYNVNLEDYEKGRGAKNQTDLEKNPKMSMMKTIMSDYNDSTVKDSFTIPEDNPFKNM